MSKVELMKLDIIFIHTSSILDKTHSKNTVHSTMLRITTEKVTYIV